VRPRRPLSVAAVGISTAATCGVRDHATLLARALPEQRVSCSLHWLTRPADEPARAARQRIGAWLGSLSRDLQAERPDAVLLHYSVFSYSHRGFPLFVRPLLSTVRASGAPIVAVLHEYAFPWRRGGARGAAWAVSQRALLLEVIRASSAVAVTTGWRADWLSSRAWLPRRPTVTAPVFSNLPAPAHTARPAGEAPVVGLFGYAYEPWVIALVLDALAQLKQAGTHARLLLIGAPGGDSSLGREWEQGARTRGLEGDLGFSGKLAPQQLSDRLAECDVLLSGEPSGPTSRKTTLAASLASGRPVVALDGRRTWGELVAGEAAMVVAPAPGAVADALAGLLANEDGASSLGERGRAFAAQTMTASHSAEVLAALLDELVSSRSGPVCRGGAQPRG
jgi:glycosyltransferase involved in cell wall biosynthesis